MNTNQPSPGPEWVYRPGFGWVQRPVSQPAPAEEVAA